MCNPVLLYDVAPGLHVGSIQLFHQCGQREANLFAIFICAIFIRFNEQ
jgi:hypothetical protein